MAQLLTLWRGVSGKIEQDESENTEYISLNYNGIYCQKRQFIRSIDCNIDFECVPASMLLYRFGYIYYLLLLFVHAQKV